MEQAKNIITRIRFGASAGSKWIGVEEGEENHFSRFLTQKPDERKKKLHQKSLRGAHKKPPRRGHILTDLSSMARPRFRPAFHQVDSRSLLSLDRARRTSAGKSFPINFARYRFAPPPRQRYRWPIR